MSDYVPFQGGLTIEEFVDRIQTEISVSCALPKTLPDANIRQIVESRALPWFYRNYQFAVQGAVDSSSRNLKLAVDTVTTNAARSKNSNLTKNKASPCNTPWPLNFSQSGPYENKKLCYYKGLPQYQYPSSQPGSYRYYPGTVFSSNHFSQSPNTYNTTSGSAAYR